MNSLSVSRNALTRSCFLKAKATTHFFFHGLSSIGEGKEFLKLLSYDPIQKSPFLQNPFLGLLLSRVLVCGEESSGRNS